MSCDARHTKPTSSKTPWARAWSWWLTLLFTLAVATPSRTAWANVTAQLNASSARVEVGQPLRVELTVSSDEGTPESPRLTIPNGFGLRGPSISTRFSTSINGWSATTRREIGATWEVSAPRVGTYTLGPAQAFIEGKPVTSNAITVEVVPPGTLPAPAPTPRRRPRSLFDDDDFFSGFPGMGRPGRSMLDDLMQQQVDMFPGAPPEYHLSEAKDPTAFLMATVSPERAVIGQQVTLRVTAYGAAGRYRESDTREPRRADFFSVPLIENSGQQQMYSVRVGETDYLAIKVREFALFPLKTGKLEIGPMKMAFYGSNYVSRSTGQPLERESQPLFVEVVEPPVKGRPLDYQLGDVGNFRLSATVNPRTISEGDSFSVVAVLEGEGHLPEALRVPEQTGLEWLAPTITEQRQVNARKRLEGKRTFTFIVKATRAGDMDLGALGLPFFNPDKNQYGLASAALGKISVQPQASAPSTDASSSPVAARAVPEMKLSELATARQTLRPFTPSSHHWSDSNWFWPVLLGMPLGAVVTQLLAERSRTYLRRRREQRSSLSMQINDELKKAEQLLAQNAEDAAVAALERAVFLAIENATRIKARAVLRERLVDTLRAAGVDARLAEKLVELLKDLEAWRFTRAGAVPQLTTSTRQLVNELSRHEPKPQREAHP